MGKTSMPAFLVLCLALVSCSEAVGGLRGGNRPPNEKTFNVVKFGAKPGGVKDSTEGFMQAWVAACRSNGNARVVVPPGIFKASALIFAGPCKTQGPVIFQIQGTIKADTDLSNYPDKGWISFESVNGLVITGGGFIDGQGPSLWQYNDCKTNPSCSHLPSSIYMNNVQNCLIRGIHLVNSMGFHMHITTSKNIRIQRIEITAPGTSPNTDGIHISKTQTVKIGNSKIGTGDDCISLGQGATNVSISKITCGPGHGISVGSLGKLPNELDVKGVTVKNCTLDGTTNGVRIKTWPGSPPSNAVSLLFSNIIMKNVQNPIIIDQGYGDKSSHKPSRVKISNVIYQNIVGTTVSPIAVNLKCSHAVPCENVSLRNINLKFTGLKVNSLFSSTCTNARVGYSGFQFPPPCKQ